MKLRARVKTNTARKNTGKDLLDKIKIMNHKKIKSDNSDFIKFKTFPH